MSSKSSLLAIIALTLATVSGCAAGTVTRSSALEPGASVPALGALRPDNPPPATPEHRAERHVVDRTHARSIEHRTLRYDACRRCSK